MVPEVKITIAGSSGPQRVTGISSDSLFKGIDSPFEEPISPALTLDTANQDVDASVNEAVSYILEKIAIS